MGTARHRWLLLVALVAPPAVRAEGMQGLPWVAPPLGEGSPAKTDGPAPVFPAPCSLLPAPTRSDCASGTLPSDRAWLVSAEVGVIKPYLLGSARTRQPVNRSFSGPVYVPVAGLDWTVSPRITVERQLDPGQGSVWLRYRLVASEGSDRLQSAGKLRTVLDVNEGVLAYRSRSLLCDEETEDLRLGVGARVGDVFFGSRARGRPTLESRVGSYYIGAGPAFYGEYRKQLPGEPGWAYLSLGGGPLFGAIRQRFVQEREGDRPPAHPAGVLRGEASTGWLARNIGTLGGEVGVTWDVCGFRCPVRVGLAYTLEKWWHIGLTRDSDAHLLMHGPLVRVEVKF